MRNIIRHINKKRWLIISVILAAVVHVVLTSGSLVVARDGITFVTLAGELRENPVEMMRAADQHPGYPAMILAGRWVLSPVIPSGELCSWIRGAQTASGTCGLLLIVVAWFLTRQVFDRRCADVCAVLIAILPIFRHNAADALSDTPHLLFFTVAVWLTTVGLKKRHWSWFAAAGASGGVAFWIRPEGICVVLVTAAMLPVWAAWKKTFTARQTALCVSAMLLAAAVVLMPYVIISGKITSKLMNKPFLVVPAMTAPQDKSLTARQDEPVPPPLPPRKIESPLPTVSVPKTEVLSEETEQEPHILLAATREFTREASHSLRHFLVLPLFVGIFFSGFARGTQAPRLILVGLIALHVALMYVLYMVLGRYISHRHLMPPLLLSLPWVASGLVLMTSWIADFLTRLFRKGLPDEIRLCRRIALTLTLAALAIGLISKSLHSQHPSNSRLIAIAQDMRDRVGPNEWILTNSPYVGFYSQRRVREITRAEAECGIDLTDIDPGYRFLVFDRDAGGFSPEWLDQIKDRYELTFKDDTGEIFLMVYELKKRRT